MSSISNQGFQITTFNRLMDERSSEFRHFTQVSKEKLPRALSAENARILVHKLNDGETRQYMHNQDYRSETLKLCNLLVKIYPEHKKNVATIIGEIKTTVFADEIKGIQGKKISPSTAFSSTTNSTTSTSSSSSAPSPILTLTDVLEKIDVYINLFYCTRLEHIEPATYTALHGLLYDNKHTLKFVNENDDVSRVRVTIGVLKRALDFLNTQQTDSLQDLECKTIAKQEPKVTIQFEEQQEMLLSNSECKAVVTSSTHRLTPMEQLLNLLQNIELPKWIHLEPKVSPQPTPTKSMHTTNSTTSTLSSSSVSPPILTLTAVLKKIDDYSFHMILMNNGEGLDPTDYRKIHELLYNNIHMLKSTRGEDANRVRLAIDHLKSGLEYLNWRQTSSSQKLKRATADKQDPKQTKPFEEQQEMLLSNSECKTVVTSATPKVTPMEQLLNLLQNIKPPKVQTNLVKRIIPDKRFGIRDPFIQFSHKMDLLPPPLQMGMYFDALTPNTEALNLIRKCKPLLSKTSDLLLQRWALANLKTECGSYAFDVLTDDEIEMLANSNVFLEACVSVPLYMKAFRFRNQLVSTLLKDAALEYVARLLGCINATTISDANQSPLMILRDKVADNISDFWESLIPPDKKNDPEHLSGIMQAMAPFASEILTLDLQNEYNSKFIELATSLSKQAGDDLRYRSYFHWSRSSDCYGPIDNPSTDLRQIKKFTGGAFFVDENAIAPFEIPNLEELHLFQSYWNESLLALPQKLNKLEKLTVRGRVLIDSPAPLMPTLRTCKFETVPAETIRQFAQKFPKLERLELINCDIDSLPLGLPESCEVRIHGCPHLVEQSQTSTYAWGKLEELILKAKQRSLNQPINPEVRAPNSKNESGKQ